MGWPLKRSWTHRKTTIRTHLLGNHGIQKTAEAKRQHNSDNNRPNGHCDYKCWSLLWIPHIMETPGRTLYLLGESHLTLLIALIFVLFIKLFP